MPPRPRFNAGGWAAIGIAVAGPVAMTVAVLTCSGVGWYSAVIKLRFDLDENGPTENEMRSRSQQLDTLVN